MLGLVNLVVWWIDILACTVIKPNCLLQFVADGVFKAELNNFLTRELAEDGYSGVEVRVTPTRTEIIILATRTQNVLGEKGRRIRELTSVVQKRFNFPEGTVEVIIFYSLQNWITSYFSPCEHSFNLPFVCQRFLGTLSESIINKQWLHKTDEQTGVFNKISLQRNLAE